MKDHFTPAERWARETTVADRVDDAAYRRILTALDAAYDECTAHHGPACWPCPIAGLDLLDATQATTAHLASRGALNPAAGERDVAAVSPAADTSTAGSAA